MTTGSIATTADTPLERSSHCTSATQNLLKRLTYMVLSEGLKTQISQSFLACGAATKFVLSRVDSLSLCRHLLYTFRDVSSTIAMQWAKSRPRPTLQVGQSTAKSKSWVTSYGYCDIISCPVFKTKVSTFRSWKDVSNATLFVATRWKIRTQWLSKLYRRRSIFDWVVRNGVKRSNV